MSETPEVLAQFDEPIESDAGVSYVARALAEPTTLGHWEGRIEFTPVGGGAPVATERETTQPNRADLAYWVTGLSRVYLQGALARALGRDAPPAAPAVSLGTAPLPVTSPVLDPFAVYAQGEDVLRRELGALSFDHLRAIVRAYGIDADASATGDLVEGIVADVRRRVTNA